MLLNIIKHIAKDSTLRDKITEDEYNTTLNGMIKKVV